LVHPKSDLEAVRECAQQGYPVSSLTLAGISELLAKVEELARSVLPADDQISLNRRQAALVSEAHDSLMTGASAGDLALCAEGLRQARSALDRLTGRAGLDDLLDVLFSRFCLGK
jgi:tRNA modification GTPase